MGIVKLLTNAAKVTGLSYQIVLTSVLLYKLVKVVRKQ